MYAAGKIPGSFFKREGRAGEKGTLTARMIDRPIRPLFPKGWRRETQLVSIPMSIDHDPPLRHPRDERRQRRAAWSPTSPFPPPVGAVRIGQDEEGSFVVNPDEEWLLEPTLDLVVAGTEEAILMVEAGAKEVTEAEILDALDIAHGEIKKLCAGPARAAREGRQARRSRSTPPQVDEAVLSEVKDQFGAALDEATQVEDKLERQDATKRVEEEVARGARPATADGPTPTRQAPAAVQLAFDKLEKDDHPPADRGRQEAPRRPRRGGDPRHLDRGRRRAAHARLGDLHPRPDAGLLGRGARHHA